MRKNAVVYMRYSSHNQSEASIDGQRKIIKQFAERKENEYTIIREYIDRALTGKNDKRDEFHKMINDSMKHQFDYVIIYSIDRFARNRYDSAIYKTRLKKNGVKVVSATEPITDDPAGIMVEGVLESMAEYFSAELSQKVKRGISLSKEKCKHLGGYVNLGYTVDENKNYQIDPVTAPVVQMCFELCSAGNSLKQINEALMKEFGKSFFKNACNSLNRILDNRNYIGIYTRGGADIPDGMPRIISDDLFERVQQIRAKKKKTPAGARAEEEYLLTTKLFCGHCRQERNEDIFMVGVSGTSKTGKVHNYYTCKNVWKKHICKKKNVKKKDIENFIIAKAREQLTNENIDIIAETVSEISKRENNTPIIAGIKRKLKENMVAIKNLLKAIETGEHMDLVSERITEKKQEKADLEKSLAREQMEKREIDVNEIKFFLHNLKKGNIDDIIYQRALINIFVNAIYLYDDKATIAFNASDKPVTIDFSLIDQSEKSAEYGDNPSSYMMTTSPP